MNERTIVGARPRLPKILDEWTWLSRPVPAERLAALRIGVGLVLLCDVLLTYWPFRYDYFGWGSLGDPNVFSELVAAPRWSWSLIHWFPNLFTPTFICLLWASAAMFLVLGILPRLAAIIAWAMAISVMHSNLYLHNSGDLVRQHLLFLLMLTPCGAAWSIMRPRGIRRGEKTAVYPWALRLIFVELVTMYFFNGVYKLVFGAEWQDGSILHYVIHTPGWARWSPPFEGPSWVLAALAYFVLGWELLFPILVLIKPTRIPALAIGAAFHVVTSFQLEIGLFGLYALCMYLPLLPWEALGRKLKPIQHASMLEHRRIGEPRSCVPA